jgi:SEC-C motif-containing protein
MERAPRFCLASPPPPSLRLDSCQPRLPPQPTSKLPYVEDPEESTPGWSRLAVHSHEPGKNPDQAFVDFSAYFVEQGAEHALHEKSEFHRVAGEWFYTRPVRQGPAPVKSAQTKVGRNDPCPCGSGKKYKRCCQVV